MEKTPVHNLSTKRITSVAHANIALIKYWGKRSVDLNLPATGSISITLDALKTETSLQFDHSLSTDQFLLDGQPATPAQLKKVSQFLDLMAGTDERPFARISSRNSFPTGAGLASSASGFAALAAAASHALHKAQSLQELSRLARQGSGSAARSVYGGFAEMKCGNDETGEDDYAVSLFDEDYWDLRVLIAITDQKQKSVGSTEGMKRTSQSSAFYESWVASSQTDITTMRNAISQRDFTRMGELAEQSSFKMHGLMLSSAPPLLYWNAATVKAIHTVWGMRNQGTEAYVTIDAGPQVKVLCRPESIDSLKKALEDVEGIQQVMESGPGPGIAIKEAN